MIRIEMPFAALLAVLALTSLPVYAQKYGDTVYNRFNIHYYIGVTRGNRTEYKASYANWVKPGKPEEHGILPPNTELRISRWRGGFLLTVTEDRKQIFFQYNARNMNGLGLADYFKLILSKEKVTYEDLSAKDKEGIKAGKALPGMTKQGVKIALGYPALHKTPSLDLNRWVYWQNMFRSMAVNFKDGKVASVKQ